MALEEEAWNTNELPVEVENAEYQAAMEAEDKLIEETMRDLEAWQEQRIDAFVGQFKRSHKGNWTAKFDSGERVTIYVRQASWRVCVDPGDGTIRYLQRDFETEEEQLNANLP
jgi:hypothetical protein